MKISKFHPKVSIIIPVYNGSNYLKEAIDSALCQTYEDIEVIVVNDGSNDGGKTDKICRSYGNQIRYFKKDNGGVATALNKGIEEMTGEYFSWLSHDDVYYPNKIEEQVKFLNTLKDKNTIIYSSCTLINENGKVTGSTNLSKEYPIESFNNGYFSLFKGLMNGCSMLIHKDCFKKVGVFDLNLPTTQDYQLWFNMFKVFPVQFVNKDLIKSRIHNQQGSIVNPDHIREADALWIRMVKGIAPNDISSFAVNLYNFYKDVAEHLERSPLREAYEYTKKLVYKNENLVSIILPVYNREYCIKKAMDSVFSQTYKKYELIIVDDGSTDNTEKEIKKYKNNKTLYIKQQNGGVSNARNTGIREARGKYIAFLDSDDYWTRDHLKKHIDVLKENEECMMSYNNFQIENSISQHIFHPATYPQLLFISYNSITTPSVVLKNRVLRDVGLFDESMDMCEDLDLWRRIAKKYCIKEIDELLTTIVLRENQFSADDFLVKRYLYIKKAYDDDKELSRDTLLSLLIELWTVYFSNGASIEVISANLNQSLKDYKFLEEYMRRKALKGALYLQLHEELNVSVQELEESKEPSLIKRKGYRFLELILSQGFRTTLKNAVKKYSSKFINGIRNIWKKLKIKN